MLSSVYLLQRCEDLPCVFRHERDSSRSARNIWRINCSFLSFPRLDERKSITGRQSHRNQSIRSERGASRLAKNSLAIDEFLSPSKVSPPGTHSGPLLRGLPGEFPTDRGEPTAKTGSYRLAHWRRDSLRLSPRSPTSSPLTSNYTYMCACMYRFIRETGGNKETGGDAGAAARRDATRQTSVPHACGGRRESVCRVLWSNVALQRRRRRRRHDEAHHRRRCRRICRHPSSSHSRPTLRVSSSGTSVPMSTGPAA